MNEFKLHVLLFTITGGVSSSAFGSLVGYPIGIAGSAVGLKICAITVEIKNYMPIIKKKTKKS